jgi:Ser/Thr protein kinase RdoA (MazF antagonist)
MITMDTTVLKAFGFEPADCFAIPFGSGLINHTWKINHAEETFILQCINRQVFPNPQAIADNINLLSQYLKANHPDYLFVSHIKSNKGEDWVLDTTNGAYYRLFPFIKGSHTIDVVDHPDEAFEAAAQFGRFTKLLSGFDAGRLSLPLPDFHNLSLRYRQFEMALKTGNPVRIIQSKDLIEYLMAQRQIVLQYGQITTHPQFHRRVTHHDTKISNVLFDSTSKALCVIDLDTVMPGYFISDVGDMMRTYLSPVSEEAKDFSAIEIRPAFYQAIKEGYLGEMQGELTDEELSAFDNAGFFMIYMQAIRFLTDHLNDDRYYGAIYEGHNFIRAGNQTALLKALTSYKKISGS